jgi:hypothetical protein
MVRASQRDAPQPRIRCKNETLHEFRAHDPISGVLSVPIIVLIAVGKALELVHKLTDPLAALPVAAGNPGLLASGLLIRSAS